MSCEQLLKELKEHQGRFRPGDTRILDIEAAAQGLEATSEGRHAMGHGPKLQNQLLRDYQKEARELLNENPKIFKDA